MFIFIKLWFCFCIAFVSTFVAAEENNRTENSVSGSTQKAYKERIYEDNRTNTLKYSFFAHKPFYILPYSYSFNPTKKATGTIDEIDRTEVKFQFSFKLNIINSFYKDYLRLSFAYTNLSYWQLYNKANSAPFRETNHEPELFFEFKPDGVSTSSSRTFYRLGFIHQSNGQDIELSRSWNRFYIQTISDLKYTTLSLMIWQRLKEAPKKNPQDTEGDDNPDILKFMGHFELRASSKFKKSTLTLVLRNNLRKENKGAVELSYSFPLGGKFKGYIQYFNGYGESLIDYNSSIQRIGAGLVIADWL